jgi:UPF0755 protein
MKSFVKKAVLLTVFLLLIAAILTAYFVQQWNSPYISGHPESNDATTLVRVPSGASLYDVADSLQTKDLLDKQKLFIYGTKILGLQTKIKAGLFAIPNRSSLDQILDIVISGHPVPVRVTIPEGVDATQVADILSKALGFSPQQFLADADSITEILIDLPTADLLSYKELLNSGACANRKLFLCEGYLFPETYHFSEGITSDVVASLIINLGLEKIHYLLDDPISDFENISIHEVLTLASIVEAETIFDSEKPKVSAVYQNRLNANHSLEADPTIAFFLSKKGKRIYYKDLREVSPYNTYRNKGLPPGPINNPGFIAIRSVFQPEPKFDAFYFVANGKGGHQFSKTHKEHKRASAAYRKIRDSAR